MWQRHVSTEKNLPVFQRLNWWYWLFQGIGDMNLAYQCFRLTLSSNNDHAEAYNNLGVLEMRKGHFEQVSIFIWTTSKLITVVSKNDAVWLCKLGSVHNLLHSDKYFQNKDCDIWYLSWF